jgi:hypothetical protein
MNVETKAAVTVAEMARMVGLSRSRFYQLLGSAFPEPSRDEQGRPYFNEEQQRSCLEVRRRNCGIDGRAILFYAPRLSGTSKPQRVEKPRSTAATRHGEIVEAVRALGLTSITAAQVDQAIKNSFPNGIEGVATGEVIRSVFLSLKRQDSTDKVG